MNIFPKFNKTSKCPICGTNKKGKAVLIGVDGTEHDKNIQALQYHLDCFLSLEFRSHAIDTTSLMFYSQQVIDKCQEPDNSTSDKG